MWPDRVSNPGHLTCESGALSIALSGPANSFVMFSGNPCIKMDGWLEILRPF